MKKGVYRYSVGTSDAGRRLDQFLAAQCSRLSRGLARKFIEIGGVHLDGRRTRRCAQPVINGQSVELYVDGMSLDPFRLEPQHIIYEDAFLIVLNKPAGIATQPTPARYQGTLYDALLVYLANPYRRGQKPSIGMMQRLDLDTSGVMVFSIHPRAHRNLTHAFREKRVHKHYLALVDGRMVREQGMIKTLLARRRASNLMVSVARGGKTAETHYQVLSELQAASLLKVEIPTGRSHQIRAHFAEAGHPLLGDSAYGGRSEINGVQVPRQMLHARRLQFDHPLNGEKLTFQAELPPDFSRVLERLGSDGRAD